MNNDIKKLCEKFYSIQKLQWIKTKRNGDTGVGYTFEELLHKPEENFPIPDFNSIEIKTRRKFSRKNIHLFNATPDGDYLFPIKRILNILGYPDRLNKEYRVFNMSFNASTFTKIGYYKKAKIIVDRKKQKINLVAYDSKNNNLNVYISWSFTLIKERLNSKIKTLALIIADTKIINKEEYFYYNKINFYKIKSFETFISLIENGTITITFKIGVFRSGQRKGQIHDRGTDFSLSHKDINKLYNLIQI